MLSNKKEEDNRARKPKFKQVGRTESGKAIYRNMNTGTLAVEEDYERLVEADEEDLKGAELWE